MRDNVSVTALMIATDCLNCLYNGSGTEGNIIRVAPPT